MHDATSSPATHAIIGAAFEVHRSLGPGLMESAYGDGLEVEFEHLGIAAEREVPIQLSHRGRPLRTTYRADYVALGVLVELKAIADLTRHEEAQLLHYLRATKMPVGLLINFGSTSVQIRRMTLRGASEPVEHDLAAIR